MDHYIHMPGRIAACLCSQCIRFLRNAIIESVGYSNSPCVFTLWPSVTAALVQLATFYTVPRSPTNVVYFWTVIESNP